jgi:NTP pyrophosphatase (non-canonical NTP hydrolase)
MDERNRVSCDVQDERDRQDDKWGEQNHDPITWCAILTEEVGELAQAALQTRFGGAHGGLDLVRKEAVQVAAVAQAIVECLDRGTWTDR